MVRPECQKKGIATAMFKLAYDRVRPSEAVIHSNALIYVTQAKQTGATLALSTGISHNVRPFYAVN